MTESVLKEIVHRAVRDGSFRAQLKSDPAGALAGFSLTKDERSAIASGDPTRLSALGVDQRMSKAFAAGVLGDASKVIVLDPGAGGAGVVDEAASVRSPMWRIEQDLDTAGTAASPDAAFDATGLREIERESTLDTSVDAGPATEHSSMRRIEQDLDTSSAARSPEGYLGEDYFTGPSAEAPAMTRLQQIEQDLDAGSSLKDVDSPGEDQQTQATDDGQTPGTQVEDLNQNYPGDSPDLTEY